MCPLDVELGPGGAGVGLKSILNQTLKNILGSPGTVLRSSIWSSGSRELDKPLGYRTCESRPSGSSHTWCVRPGKRLNLVSREGQYLQRRTCDLKFTARAPNPCFQGGAVPAKMDLQCHCHSRGHRKSSAMAEDVMPFSELLVETVKV